MLVVHRFALRLDDPITDWFVAAFAAAVLLGDCFSPWLRFKGGKGAATSFGAILGFCWPAALIAIAVWIAGTLAARYSSVGSVAGSLVAPVAIWFFIASPALTCYGAFAALLIILMRNRNAATRLHGALYDARRETGETGLLDGGTERLSYSRVT